jgi:uncharacterized cupredoxin-like copper-binding protein
MRKSVVLSTGLIAALAVSACAPSSSGSNATPNNAIVRITDSAMKMKVDYTVVPSGKVTFLVFNQDTVEHEVVILKTDKAADKLALLAGSSKVDEEGAGENVGEVEVEPGATAAATFDLEPGKYALICNVLSHYMAGMFTAFEVKASAATQAKASAQPAASKAPAAQVPAGKKEVASVTAVRSNLTDLVDAVQKADVPAARKALKAYDTSWNGIEVYVSYRNAALYSEIETVWQAKVTTELNATPPDLSDAREDSKTLLAKFDQAIKLVTDGATISPLFDDVATLRILRTNTLRDATPALKAGDFAAAKPLLTTFITKWSEVEDMVHDRSADIYAEIESAMGKVNTAIQKPDAKAADVAPLVDTLSNRFNYAISLFNAAARGADITKTTFSKDDVANAASLAIVNNELKASFTSWQAGKYAEASDHAKKAMGSFGTAAPALKAKSNADAPLQKALDAYVALADKAGDAATIATNQKAAVEAVGVAQQWIVGQFWTDPKLKDAISAAIK